MKRNPFLSQQNNIVLQNYTIKQAEEAWYINDFLHFDTILYVQIIKITIQFYRIGIFIISNTYDDVGKNYGIFCASRNILQSYYNFIISTSDDRSTSILIRCFFSVVHIFIFSHSLNSFSPLVFVLFGNKNTCTHSSNLLQNEIKMQNYNNTKIFFDFK